MGRLSLRDKALDSSLDLDRSIPFQDLKLGLQLQILDRRLKDARIGAEAIWTALNDLIDGLTLRKFSLSLTA